MDYDVIIIGGGAAGMSAALWCAELGLKALLLEAEAELRGQLLWIYNEIKNHLGGEAENGRELRDVFVRQIRQRDFEVRLLASIAEVDLEKKTISLNGGETFSAEFIVIATGVKRRRLNVAGEDKFKNKGIIDSGRREPNSVKNKTVIVIGGGDAAFENALLLAETAAQVFLVHRGKDFRARKEFVEKAEANPKVEIIHETVVAEIIGSDRVEAVEIKNLKTGKTKNLTTSALLIRIGVAPVTKMFRGKVDTDEQGYIKIDSRCETSVRRVFAVGDAANPVAPTISSAVGMGATAAKAIFAELKS